MNYYRNPHVDFRKVTTACCDCVFILRQIIENDKIFQKKHVLFIGYVKAFDKGRRNELWDTLMTTGIPLLIIKVMINIYKDSNT
jgi:hypothetical protein